MEIAKTTRLDIRLTAVIRGKLAEDAGPYGSLSGVARRIIEAHYLKIEKNGKRPVRRALAVLLISLCLASPSLAGDFYVSGSAGLTSFIRTIDDGTWIQEGLPHNFHPHNVGWRAGAGYRINPQWSVQTHYVNLGTVRLETLAVGDDRYDPNTHTCLSRCDKAIPFHTHDLMEGAELSLSRHWSFGPVEPFLRAGGAAMYHRLTAQWQGATGTMHGWIPTALVGGGVCVGWLCGETTYYYGFGGGTDWSAGLPISKQAVQTLLTINVPLNWGGSHD